MQEDLPRLTGVEFRDLIDLVALAQGEGCSTVESERLSLLVQRRADGQERAFQMAQLLAGLQWKFDPRAKSIRRDLTSFLTEICATIRPESLHAVAAQPPPLASVVSRQASPARQPSIVRSLVDFLRSHPRPTAAFAVLIPIVAVIVFGAFSLISRRERPAEMPAVVSAPAQPVAVIAHSAKVRWLDRVPRPDRDVLHAGELMEIASGVLELQLKQGATVLVEGPAECKVDAQNQATLLRGKLIAKVPARAVGLTIETPNAKIVDLGTELGVEVLPNLLTSVSVFKGAVRVETAGHGDATGARRTPSRVSAGNSVQVRSTGEVVPIPYRKEQSFVRRVENERQPTNANGCTAIAQYRISSRPVDGPTAPQGEISPVSPSPESQFQGLLRGIGQVSYAAQGSATSEPAIRFEAGSRQALLTASGLPVVSTQCVLEVHVLPEEMFEGPVVYYGDMLTNGFGIAVRLQHWSLMFGGVGVLHGDIACEPGRWTHVAAVLEDGRASLFVDGKLASPPWRISSQPGEGSLFVGGHPASPNQFVGFVDYVGLLKLNRPFEPKMLFQSKQLP